MKTHIAPVEYYIMNGMEPESWKPYATGFAQLLYLPKEETVISLITNFISASCNLFYILSISSHFQTQVLEGIFSLRLCYCYIPQTEPLSN
jgi:hypothetical protein